MKKILFTILFLAPFIGFAQKLKEYHASNGKTYHPGDTIKVGLGSMPNGDFKYIQINQLLPGPPDPRRSNSMNARKDMSGSGYVIKKIQTVKQWVAAIRPLSPLEPVACRLAISGSMKRSWPVR